MAMKHAQNPFHKCRQKKIIIKLYMYTKYMCDIRKNVSFTFFGMCA